MNDVAAKKLWHVGTLTYDRAGLVRVFAWMLWGDFCLNMIDDAGSNLVQVQLKKFGASNTLIGIVQTSIVEYKRAAPPGTECCELVPTGRPRPSFHVRVNKRATDPSGLTSSAAASRTAMSNRRLPAPEQQSQSQSREARSPARRLPALC